MTLTTLLYLTDLLSNIENVSSTLSILYVVALMVTLLFMALSAISEDEGMQVRSRKTFNILYDRHWIFLIALTINIVIPSEKTIYLMLGTAYLSDTKIPAQVQEALELKLGDVIKTLKAEK